MSRLRFMSGALAAWQPKPPYAGAVRSTGEITMIQLVVFTLGYLLGGVTALVILGLTVAACRRDSGNFEPTRIRRRDESTPAWR
jgi:hypothetical protein